VSEKLEFDLTVKNNQLNKALDEGAKKANNLEGILETALGVFGGNLITKGFDALVGGFDAVISIGKEAVDAAAAQEVAVNNLNNALIRSGNYSKEASESILQFAGALQATTVFEDDAVIANAALLESLTNLNANGLKQGISAAADFATVLGVDLETATRLVAKAAEGNTEAFKRYGVEIKKGSTDAESFANTVDALNKQFGGAATAQLNTYSGSLKAATNAYGDLLEPIGDIIVKNPIVISLFNQVKDLLNETNGEVTGLVPVFQSLVKDGLIAASVGAQVLFDALDGITIVSKGLINILQIVGGVIAVSLVTPIEDLIDGLIFLGSKIPGIGEQFEGLQNPIGGATESIKDFISNGVEGLKNSADGNVFRSLSEGVDSFTVKLLDGAAAVEAANAKTKENNESRKSNEEEVNAAILASRQNLGVEIQALEQQLRDQDIAFREANAALDLELQGVNDEAKLQRILEQKLRENEVVFQQELAKAKLIEDAGVRELSIQKANDAKKLADTKATNDKELALKRDLAAQEKQIFNARISATSAFLSLGEALAKEGSVVAKGLASANAVVQTYAGATQVLGDPLIPVLAKPALVAATIANGLANVARINGVKFAEGGFINGAGGATMGPDTTTAQVRDGEMVLNASQQKQLFDAINGGSLRSGGDIVIQINSREIARAVRDEINSGFVLA